MLSIIVYLHNLRWVVPIGFIVGSGPNCLGLYLAWRLLSLPLPRRAFEWGDERIYAVYQRLILFVAENYGGSELVLYGDSSQIFNKKENVVFMCNHQSEFDWIITNMLAVRQGSLGNVRYTLKDGLRFLPLYGYYFRQHSCIYINKTGKFNEEKCCKQIAEFKRHKTPVWLVVFPEGSRFSSYKKSLIKKSEKYAQEQGFPILTQHLTPRAKMVQICIDSLRDYVDAVYDVTTAYSSTLDPDTGARSQAPGLADIAMGACPEIHIHVNRIDIKDVPKDEETFRKWLHMLYVNKDKLLQHFYSSNPSTQGKFKGEFQRSKLNLAETLPSVLFFAVLSAPLFYSQNARSMYAKFAMLGSVLGCAWMAVRY